MHFVAWQQTPAPHATNPQLTVQSLPVQVTFPAPHELVPLQLKLHVCAEQSIPALHELVPKHATEHELPPHEIFPPHADALLHWISQLDACVQFTPPAHELYPPQITLQGTPFGHTTGVGHPFAPMPQSITHVLFTHVPPFIGQTCWHVGGGGAESFASLRASIDDDASMSGMLASSSSEDASSPGPASRSRRVENAPEHPTSKRRSTPRFTTRRVYDEKKDVSASVTASGASC